MITVMRPARLLVLASILVLLACSPVLGYIDPGAGSMAYQIVLAGILAVGYGIMRVWQRLTSSFGHRKPDETDHTDGGAS